VRTTLNGRDGNTVKLAVEVPSEELKEAFDARLRQLVREMRIPGFRPGKAPVAMVRQRLGDEAILADAVEESMTRWFAQAMVDLDLDPVDRPEIELNDELPELDKPLGFRATVTVMPEVVLGDYKGLVVPKEPVEVEDEEVNARVERLQNEFAELRPVACRPAQKGDYVTADFHASLDGKPVGELAASDYAFELGGDRMFPQVQEQVVGMGAGEERTFPFTLPEGPPGADMGGKTVDFVLSVKEIKEKVVPRVSDQWASEVSEFATLLELRQEIRTRLGLGKAHASEQQFRAAALAKAVDNVTLDLPDVTVQREVAEMLTDFKSSLEARGASLEGYLEATGMSIEQFIESIKPQAATNVKTRLVLDAVVKAEGLEASDEDVRALVAQMAAASKTDSKALDSRLRKSGRMEVLKEQVIRDKAAELIVKSAVEGPSEPKESAGKPAPAKKRSQAAGTSAPKETTAKSAAKKPLAPKTAAAKATSKKPAAPGAAGGTDT
jgi:trigger factor